MTSPIIPVSIRSLFHRLRPEEAREVTAAAMAKAPDRAISQIQGLLEKIDNAGHPYGVGYASGTAVAAGASLQEFVDAARDGPSPSRACFADKIVKVCQLEDDLRRQLGMPGSERRREELQEALAMAVRVKRFLDGGTG